MIFVTGPAYAGKRDYLLKTLGLPEQDCAFEVQTLAFDCENEEQLTQLCARLCHYAGVTASEMGGGVVPVSASQRRQREQAGRLAQRLAAAAEKTVRVWCGIAEELK